MGARYAIVKRGDGWVISVDGLEILTCNRRSVALQIVKQAGERSDDIATVPEPDVSECLLAAG